MTKLTEDIYQALLVEAGIEKIVDGNPITAGGCQNHAEIAAEIAKRYIEKAFEAGKNYSDYHEGIRSEYSPDLKNFMRNEGVIE